MVKPLKAPLVIGLMFCTMFISESLAIESNQVSVLKQTILERAEAFKGKGDPDYSKQKEMEQLVNKLIELSPQKTVQERLPLIMGAWQQIWGPYTYKDDSRGVDPALNPEHIYQVVFPEGYYYNVSPEQDSKGRSKNRTVLLRGQYKLDAKRKNIINVQFTHLRAVKGTPPENLTYTKLPELSEAKKLKQFNLLPSFFVRLFLGNGSLYEVYTDKDLRITYGSKRHNLSKNYIYILKKITP